MAEGRTRPTHFSRRTHKGEGEDAREDKCICFLLSFRATRRRRRFGDDLRLLSRGPEARLKAISSGGGPKDRCGEVSGTCRGNMRSSSSFFTPNSYWPKGSSADRTTDICVAEMSFQHVEPSEPRGAQRGPPSGGSQARRGLSECGPHGICAR